MQKEPLESACVARIHCAAALLFAEVPMSDLEEAWLGGVKQMAMALPPEHPMFETALRELGRCAGPVTTVR